MLLLRDKWFEGGFFLQNFIFVKFKKCIPILIPIVNYLLYFKSYYLCLDEISQYALAQIELPGRFSHVQIGSVYFILFSVEQTVLGFTDLNTLYLRCNMGTTSTSF